MGLIDKALGKTVEKVVKGASKAISDVTRKGSSRVTPKITAKPSAKPSAKTPTPAPSTSVLSTTPTSPLVTSAITPSVRPSLILPGRTSTPAAIIRPSAPARVVRSADTQAAMQAERVASEQAIAASRAAAAQARTFGQPTRGLAPAPTQPSTMVEKAITPTAPRTAPATPGAPAAPAAGTQAVEAAAAAPSAARRFLTGQAALNTAAFAPSAAVMAAEQGGIEVPGALKGAANIAAIIGGARLLRGARPLLTSSGRTQIKNLPSKAAQAGAVAKATALPAIGAVTGGLATKGLFTGPSATAAEAVESADQITEDQVLPPLGGEEELAITGPSAEQEIKAAIDAALGALDSGNGTKNDADTVASGQTAILEKGVNDAMDELTKAYGGPAEVDAAINAGDPILLQELAGIDADYNAGLLQIKANYAGALAQVEGYQKQADTLMKEVAAAQMAGFEAAAGGLEGMSPGVGLTGSQAAAAGVSDTALGGAGITGAALARGLAGAASAQAAADRLRLGTDLSGQLATGRLTQADLEAGLARSAMSEKAAARTDAAQRAADERALAKQQKREDAIRIAEIKYQAALDKQAEATRKEENEAARKQRIAEIKMNAELDLAMKLAAMTPEERAAYKGSAAGGKKFNAPSWYGKRDSRDPNTEIAVPGTQLGKATVSAIARAQDLLDSQLQQPEAQNPTTALSVWADFYDKIGPDARAIYAATGRPQSASAMVKQLFSTPKK